METARNIKAFGHKVILSPSISKAKGMIAVPDTFKARTNMCKVLSVGEKVELIKEGDVVLCVGAFAQRKNWKIEGLNAFFCDDSEVFARFIGKRIYPIGRRVLIERLNDERMSGDIIIPSAIKSTDQSLLGKVIGFGIPKGGQSFKVNGIEYGDIVCLEKWKVEMVEVTYKGRFCLIVDEQDILYRDEEATTKTGFAKGISF